MQIRAVAAIALSLAAVSASAQWTPCIPPETVDVRHVFVDDFRFSDEAGATAEMKRVRDALLSNITDQINNAAVENAPPLKVVPCPGRFPQPGDFTPARMQWMDHRDVVLELWSQLRPADSRHYNAELNFVVVPAYLHNLPGTSTSALLTVRYPLTSNRSYPELTAYALIGAGLRALDNHDFDYARSYLCRGLDDLRRVMPKSADNEKLFRYAAQRLKPTDPGTCGIKGF